LPSVSVGLSASVCLPQRLAKAAIYKVTVKQTYVSQRR
jgi:hypothetical protein